MNAVNEWVVTEDDLKGGGGAGQAKPRGTYTAEISRAEVAEDKNGILYLKFGLSITHGAYKKQLSFENYLPLSAKASKYQLARRNSLFKAIGLEAGSIPPGAPGGPKASALDGTVVDFALEHEFEEVPGEQYSLNTSKSKKQPWHTDGWEQKLDASGNLVVDGTVMKPRESVTFYELSDDFAGLGGGEDDSAEEAAGGDWG